MKVGVRTQLPLFNIESLKSCEFYGTCGKKIQIIIQIHDEKEKCMKKTMKKAMKKAASVTGTHIPSQYIC